jgi:signal transduction histidine kinase/two-component SAPR family response regulator
MPSTDFQLLLVDDDPGAIQVMSRMLSHYPAQRFATSGERALQLARESVPDLILLDADMPGMSGLDVCRALKADSALERVPVIFVTSYDVPELEAEALRLGAGDYVAKPLVAAQLASRVRAQLRAKAQAEGVQRDWLAAGGEVVDPVDDRPRMLIVDDDVGAVRLLRQTLDDIGDFYFAKSGEEALELASSIDPDLVLVDGHMPGMDGFSLCAALKAQHRFEHVPIVFVTRFADPHSEMRALDLGAADFIAKPFTPIVLGARVRNLLLAKRRADAELRAVHAHWRQVGDARVADIVDSASDAILSCDFEGRTVLANAAACRMFDTLHAHLIGRPIAALLGAQFLETAITPPGGPLRLALPCGDEAASTPVEVGVSAVGEGRYRLTTVVLRDVSVRERLAAQTTARVEAEATSRAKSQMLAYIAHEIGNPLNGLLGFAQLMGVDTAHPLQAPQRERLQHILDSGHQLQELMRDVMDLGAFEAGKLKIELRVVEVARVVASVVADMSALAERAGISLAVEPVPDAALVIADTARLRQCLFNILSNAIKYGGHGGRVKVGVGIDAQWVDIAVRDDGIGMDTGQLDRLFEPFNRVGPHGIDVPGAGLGLAITRQLIEAMHGRVLVDSVVSKGSCFTLRLPRALDPPSAGHGAGP